MIALTDNVDDKAGEEGVKGERERESSFFLLSQKGGRESTRMLPELVQTQLKAILGRFLSLITVKGAI